MKWYLLALIVALALCGCDRLGKGFARPVPATRKMAAPLAPQQPTPPPSPVQPPVRAFEGEPAVKQTPAKEEAVLKETPAPLPTAPTMPLILYEDSFADVAGSIRRKIDGKPQPSEGPLTTRTVYTFQAMPEDGTLTLRVFEDNQTAGPDGKPGLLVVAWDEIPKKLPWSGFVYLGGAAAPKRMPLPKLQAARTADDLRSLRLKFSHRGVNAASGTPVHLPINCRLEPVLDDSYNRRIDFGVLTAGDEWQTLDVSLAEGTNLEAFLKMVAEDNPPGFKIVFSQSGPITNYHAGDALLIDDISVTSVAAVAGE